MGKDYCQHRTEYNFSTERNFEKNKSLNLRYLPSRIHCSKVVGTIQHFFIDVYKFLVWSVSPPFLLDNSFSLTVLRKLSSPRM